MKPDYRYIDPNGNEVEAWQLTETSRYQDKLFPDWLDSRMFMTVNGNEDYLVEGDSERKIQPYSWLVNTDRGIEVVPANLFEEYDKVVKEKEVAPAPEPQLEQVSTFGLDPVLAELTLLYEVGDAGGAEEVHKELKKAIARRILWCNCAPGQCEGLDRWSCRQKSPLVQ